MIAPQPSEKDQFCSALRTIARRLCRKGRQSYWQSVIAVADWAEQSFEQQNGGWTYSGCGEVPAMAENIARLFVTDSDGGSAMRSISAAILAACEMQPRQHGKEVSGGHHPAEV